jgi:hypothetical protein
MPPNTNSLVPVIRIATPQAEAGAARKKR